MMSRLWHISGFPKEGPDVEAPRPVRAGLLHQQLLDCHRRNIRHGLYGGSVWDATT